MILVTLAAVTLSLLSMASSLPATGPHCPPPPTQPCQYGQFIHSRCGLQCLKVPLPLHLIDLFKQICVLADVVSKVCPGSGTCLWRSRRPLRHLRGGTLLLRLQQVAIHPPCTLSSDACAKCKMFDSRCTGCSFSSFRCFDDRDCLSPLDWWL